MWTVQLFLLALVATAQAANVVRKNVAHLTAEEIHDLQAGLGDLMGDSGDLGYQKISGYHGAPPACEHNGKKIACCIHGMPTFPFWHRAYTVQLERALLAKRNVVGMPYWDWTEALTSLPDLVNEPIFIDSIGGTAQRNFWHSGDITYISEKTSRAVDPRLFETVEAGHYTSLMEGVLLALEQDEFCKFEIQYEINHNAIHYLVGGNYKYSMSHLEYTSYDPIFFLHHSNVDRIFAIWQRLQELRGKDPKIIDCAHDLGRKPMEPFSWDSNPVSLTKDHATPSSLFDYHELGYSYDNLNLNGKTPEELKILLDDRASKERAFASFRLRGFGGSGDIHVRVCVPDHDERKEDKCTPAGHFFLLGGPTEMAWQYFRNYYFDITKTVIGMGLKLSGDFYIRADLFSVNGTLMGGDLLKTPMVHYDPGKGATDPPMKGHTKDLIVRKNINSLTREEILDLRKALERFQSDDSVDGYQATVEYHGLPAKCPRPDAKNRHACCVHGMATFPHWHRLFVTQFEDALVRRGSQIGIPYWDWTTPITAIPALAGDATYTDADGALVPNPFFDAAVVFEGASQRTARNMDSRLFEKPAFGEHTYFYDGIMYALEQEDFCDFEIQFEVIHNAIHAWVGGSEKYSMSSLHYTAFDPIFYLYHSNVDRIWAIWQALQIRRNKPYRAHCARCMEVLPLKPFAFDSPLNNNEKTRSNAVPIHIYDYEHTLHYTYDALTFGGKSLEELEEQIQHRQQHTRVFAGFLLAGIGTSANIDVSITKAGGSPHKAGSISILGGSKEMDWAFDRVFKFEITKDLKELSLGVDDDFSVTIALTDVDGTSLDPKLIPSPAIITEQAKVEFREIDSSRHVRKNVDHLSREEINELRKAMALLQADKSPGGFQQLGAFHGEPTWCPNPEAPVKFACCLHGMAVFPHWHRLLTVQAENALRRHGFKGALPYWDWTRPLKALPDLVAAEKYTDLSDGTEKHNPWFNGHIDTVDADTERSIRDDLYTDPGFGEQTDIAQQVLLALEQDDFCDFEVQYEIAHNFIHALVGGDKNHGMASLRYTAYDPIFFLHHTNTDRIWAIWQALQKYRGKPHNSANCALASMREPLKPFSFANNINPDAVTRDNAMPFDVFNYKANFNYEYENLELNGLSIAQLNRELEVIKGKDRVFAGFLMAGIKSSALVKFQVCSGGNCHDAGEFYLLGDENEMPWAYDRVFKYDISAVLEKNKLHYDDQLSIAYEVFDLVGSSLGSSAFHKAYVIHDPGTGAVGEDYTEEVTGDSHVRRNLEDLSKGEAESLRAAFLAIQNNGEYENIAKYHGSPGMCQMNGQPIACCVHGMPTFLQWHRLYVVQVENALLKHGAAVGVPYWDWISKFDHIPAFINDATYFNSRAQRYDPNPFFRGKITANNAVTTRDVNDIIFNSDYFYDNVMLALEQDNYCDFEIQVEIVHNAMHSYIGGKGEYSMASLDFSAFDPIFFLHHATTDKLWAIWQELQRYRNKPHDEANCALNMMLEPLKPFSQEDNVDKITHKYSKAKDCFDYQNNFGYKYDNLELSHHSIPSLEEELNARKKHDRVFAGFLLHNIGSSADIHIYVCLHNDDGTKDCNHPAGMFSVLGGALEMPFRFDRLYKFDITKTLHDLGVDLHNGNFDLSVEIRAYNGSWLDQSIFDSHYSIIFEPGTDTHQADDGSSEDILIRKDITKLSPWETVSLVRALESMQHDKSADGFQAIASFHALPPLCPNPESPDRYACCVHGMATFPQWHRLYSVQFQDSLKRHGSTVGLPYFDWTRPFTKLPDLLTQETFHDHIANEDIHNPFYQANIEFEGAGAHTARDIIGDRIYNSGNGDNWFLNQALLALEQENYCDFEVQFEVLHNAMHNFVGGKEKYGIGHLHYASYDPFFYIHHSQTDRIWAVWQELQTHRGLSGTEANCALEHMRTPLKPFAFGTPYNLNENTKEYSKPEDSFDYAKFGYRYDNLELAGISIDRIASMINQNQGKDRVFAGFLLKGFGTSATVDFKVCRTDVCQDAGYFTVLGGSMEMPWAFDRLYKSDITSTLDAMNLRHDDQFSIKTTITEYDGTVLASSIIPDPSIIFSPGHHDINTKKMSSNRIRHEVGALTDRDIVSLKSALSSLQADTGPDGYNAIATFHGLPAKCTTADGHEIACCIHGMPSFPHWHRLYVVQMEQALRRHGSSVAMPYWDWTKPIKELPSIITGGEYYDVWRDAVLPNPFSHGYIESTHSYIVRDVQDDLYHSEHDGKHSTLYNQALLALEQTDYCDFEVQFEVMHNSIHYLVGGRQVYAMSSLHYTSYDPFFFIHHSFVDKIWSIWQALQSIRKKPYNRADCAVGLMAEPMRPFNHDINKNHFTKEHAVPNTVFDYEGLGYTYDNLDLGGKNLHDTEAEINRRKNHVRVFAGFLLHGIGTSADVKFEICKTADDCYHGGTIFILGGSAEMPWTYNRLYKYDITDALSEADIAPEAVLHAAQQFFLKVAVVAVNGSVLSPSLIPAPTIMYDPGHGHEHGHQASTISGRGVRKDVDTLSSAEISSLRAAMAAVQADSGPNGFQAIAAFHGNPPSCSTSDGHTYACCTHGMATFPHWHRLYTKQMEDALYAHGASTGMPYWDWTKAFTELPALVTEVNDNSFHHGKIEYLNEITTRSPRDLLFNDPEHGSESFFYRQVLLALEQTDYCQFEVQFELTHNAIHSWVGGTSQYGMSTLDFTSYDPIFWLHHSSTDRIWAIWQALQKYRGLPYNHANCEIQAMKMPLRPFSDEMNHNDVTKANAKPTDAFEYSQLHYQYDNLNFHGYNIPELDTMLSERQKEKRTFAAFLLHGFQASADVVFDICKPDGDCVFAGTFAILGGEYEMPWSFSRLFRYDITKVLKIAGLRHDADFTFKVAIAAINGTSIPSSIIKDPTIEHESEEAGLIHHENRNTENHKKLRKDVESLSLSEANDLKDALYKLQNDHTNGGFQNIAGYHGYPNLCPESGDDKYPCCVHGMTIFPHWHRLHTIMFERALNRHGAHLGIPYWDWTKPMKSLPSFFSDSINNNPFFKYHIEGVNQDTVRELSPKLFDQPKFGEYDYLYYLTLQVLEEDSYCDFEVQYEILHNAIHAWVGGKQEFSMSTLEYSAFDPVFMIHHSGLDRIWVIWQELQKKRMKPFGAATCAGQIMEQPLFPFHYETVNSDDFVRHNSIPNVVANHDRFDYEFDQLTVHGHNVEELNEIIHGLRTRTRIFVGYVLHGIRATAVVKVYVKDASSEALAGEFVVLGGEKEMPWAYERVLRFDITDIVSTLSLDDAEHVQFRTEVFKYDGTKMDVEFHYPMLVKRPSNSQNDILILPIGEDRALPKKVVVKRGTSIKFVAADSGLVTPMVELGSFTAMSTCIVPPFLFNPLALGEVHQFKPGDYFLTGGTADLCQKGIKLHIHVDEE